MPSPAPARLVLVEGRSDAAAVETLAASAGVRLEGARIVVANGASGFARALREAGGPVHQVLGLVDAQEAPIAGAAVVASGSASIGLFVCVDDLEDELIRALGPEAVLEVLARLGELGPFRTLQQQPAQRDLPLDRQLHRFFGAGSGRKERGARALAAALEPAAAPPPLAALIEAIRAPIPDA
jgi:hypothetical protein